MNELQTEIEIQLEKCIIEYLKIYPPFDKKAKDEFISKYAKKIMSIISIYRQ